MKTYEIIQLVEVTKSMRIIAPNAEAANEKATRVFEQTLRAMHKKFPDLVWGDIQDNYAPAREPEAPKEEPNVSYLDRNT